MRPRLDKLDPTVYLARNGKDYRTPHIVKINSVIRYFKELGFRVEHATQTYRHVHGKLVKAGKNYFFKLASTKEISECTYNEMVWNRNIQKALSFAKETSFSVPDIYYFGYLNDNFYFIAEYYESNFLAKKECVDENNLRKWLPNIVRTNLFLSTIEKTCLPRDILELSGTTDFGKEFFNRDNKLLKDLREFNLESVHEIEKELFSGFAGGIVHGDFVPWHMISNNNSFVLIDSELGSSKFPKYYDTAYFFTRLYAAGKAPGLAKDFIQCFQGKLTINEKIIFNQSIYPLIASCALWNFWRRKNYGYREFTYLLMLKNDILARNII